MDKKENQEKFEAFKAEVLKWRNEHLLECKMFEKSMYENDGAPLVNVYQDVLMLLPSMVKKWKTLSLQPSTYAHHALRTISKEVRRACLVLKSYFAKCKLITDI